MTQDVTLITKKLKLIQHQQLAVKKTTMKIMQQIPQTKAQQKRALQKKIADRLREKNN